MLIDFVLMYELRPDIQNSLLQSFDEKGLGNRLSLGSFDYVFKKLQKRKLYLLFSKPRSFGQFFLNSVISRNKDVKNCVHIQVSAVTVAVSLQSFPDV